jgi:hypothetical protein
MRSVLCVMAPSARGGLAHGSHPRANPGLHRGGERPLTESIIGRHRGGRSRELCSILTPYGYSPRPSTRRLSSRRCSWRSGRAPGQAGLSRMRQGSEHGQLWLPPALLQAVPDTREHSAVSWLCTPHHGSSRMPKSSPCSCAAAEPPRPHAKRGRLTALRQPRTHRRDGAAGEVGICGMYR